MVQGWDGANNRAVNRDPDHAIKRVAAKVIDSAAFTSVSISRFVGRRQPVV